MSKYVSVIGSKYNRLTVIGEKSNGRRVIRQCRCDCGNITYTTLDKLKSGHTKSCGCLSREIGKYTRTHGMSKTRLWRIFAKMLRRCYVPEERAYEYYGGRGIRICDEWMKDRSLFFKWALENGYDENLTIDRIDVNGDYSPNNCRWATTKEQTRNRSNNRYYTFNGKTLVLTDWAREYSINLTTLSNRLERGWNIEQALTTPIDVTRRNRRAKTLSREVV